MKNSMKIFAIMMFFGTTVGFAQNMESDADKSEAATGLTASETEEVKMKAQTKMASYDADQDSQISVEEASNAENKWISENFEAMDANGDGYIDLTELEAKLTEKKLKKKTKMRRIREESGKTGLYLPP